MKNSAALVKCRHLLGRLGPHGIEASRGTGGAGSPAAAPDAILACDDGRVWLVALWEGRSVQPDLGLDDEQGTATVDEVAQSLAAWREAHRRPNDPSEPALAILAPALDQNEIPPEGWTVGNETVPVLGRQSCRGAESLASALRSRLGSVLPFDAVAHWRAEAVPEVRIAPPPRRTLVVRDTEPIAAPLLLDYKQERCARLDLEPDEDTKQLVRDFSVRLVTGVAGCGKTLVLVHRAALLAAHFPEARVLLVSHNRPLVADLRRRLERLGPEHRVHCLSFNQWLARTAGPEGDMMQPGEVRRWIERERQRMPMPALRKFSESWLADEMTWMCDHQFADDSYFEAERKGRGIRLSKNQRREMLGLLRRYRAYLASEKRDDWSSWPLSVRERRTWAVEREPFDHILIDEAQFFAPVWIDLLRHALKPGGQFFLCADPTQGFLRRRLSWATLGFDVRRRSIRLERPYRSTRAILEFARDFYQRRLPDEDEPLNLPAPEWLDTLETGRPPLVQHAGSPQDQLARLVTEVRHLTQAGAPLADIMILVAGRALPQQAVVDYLDTKLGTGAASLIKNQSAPEKSVGVAHLMASTGLERPIVFLLGIDDLAAEEADPRLTPEERGEMIRDHTRQVYVGLTRAMERLVVYTDAASMRIPLGEKEPAETIAPETGSSGR